MKSDMLYSLSHGRTQLMQGQHIQLHLGKGNVITWFSWLFLHYILFVRVGQSGQKNILLSAANGKKVTSPPATDESVIMLRRNDAQ